MNPQIAAAGHGSFSGSRLRPYLTTAQLISLAAFASPIISLLFVLFRLQASGDVAKDSVNSAKDSLQASCLAAERAASVGASLPRYLAQGVNHQITEASVATMEGVRIALTLSLTGTEALIEFVIDMYRSTFLCLLELVVRGGLSVLIAAVSEITSFINNTLTSITSGIANDISAANNIIQSAVNVVKAIPFVGDNINIPQFSIPSAAQLSGIQIPTTFEDQLRSLNSTIPTLQDLREKLDSLIAVPFQLVKKEINDTFLASQASFIATPLPVPQEKTVSFCGDTISSSFDSLGDELAGIAKTGIFIVIGSMVLFFLGYAFLTWYSQRSLRNNIERIRLLWFGNGTATTDRLLAFDALIAHPIWTQVVQFLREKFRLSQEGYDALTWFGLYIFHPAPMACLLIGIFGLLSVQVQLAIVRPLQGNYSNQISNDINGLTTTIASKLNDTMFQDSAAYAQSMNAKINGVETAINDDLFGWVNATIVPLNSTLASFYTEVQDIVREVFGNTPLDAPSQEFIRCILGSKIVGIEKALTFLHDNLHVSLPRVNETALMLSESNVNEVATPISAAAVGSGDNGEDGGLVGKIITRYIQTLEKERITFFIFMLLWAIVVVVALLIIAWHFWIVPTLRRRGMKPPRWLSGPAWEEIENADATEKPQYRDHGRIVAPVFVPMPSPLHKYPDAAAKSTSAAIIGGDNDQLRQRRAGDVRMASDLESFLDTHPQEERPSFFQKLKGLTFGRGHVAKKNSDAAILPVATGAPFGPSGERNPDSGFDWFDRVNFWKRGPSNGDAMDGSTIAPRGLDYDTPPPRPSGGKRSPNEPRGNPGLTVDVAKASANYIQPTIVLEHPDRRLEPLGDATPPNASRPSRRAGEGAANRGGDYLTVPSANKPRGPPKPTPPAWVAAMKEKELPPTRKTPQRQDSSESERRRRGEGPSSSRSAGPRRPPGLESDRYPTYPKPAATTSPRDRRNRDERGDGSLGRNASVPPRSKRAPTDSRPQQGRDRLPTKSSSLDAVDPFATPLQLSKPLPAPLEPVKLQGPATKSNNPFATPFDDSNRV
ncbi:hypothetical protein M408DRAFT_327585 [Serendipita vermifera MAFF 305830]|uniref:Plasma membrane fusion protein PRM1 n=1 Tax=Serendipita vermifera MAFF 305830 TaxID=933852 RepID=A0A0C2WZ31_SERVB|nr:hypothetical protein M408DRAFT_327585 [Serendipita vermifera MAFF 305830]